MADSEWVTIEEDEWETVPEQQVTPARLTPIEKAGQAITEAVAAPVRTIESMIGSVGELMRMQVEPIAMGSPMAKTLKGAAPALILAEHVFRKYGPKRAASFYDRKMKGLSDAAIKGAKRMSDFWEEQANKGWEAPNPEIVEARWRDRPVSKTVSAVSSGLTSIGVVVGTTFLTGQPQLGLAVLAGSETGAMYGRLRDKGVEPDVASKLAQLAGAWTYATEKIGFEHLLKPGAKTIMAALKKGGWEGAQEVIEQMGHNLLEYFGYDFKDLKSIPTAVKSAFDHIMDGWIDALVGGIGAGGLVHVVLPGARPGEPVTPAVERGVVDVIGSKMVTETKTGGWKLQTNELENGKYEVEGYWFPFIGEVSKPEVWNRIYNTQDEAQKVFDSIISLKNIKSVLAQPPTPEAIITPPTVEELTKKPIEKIEPQTVDHVVGHQYGLSNEQVDSRLQQAELRYRELKLKETDQRTAKETDELAFLTDNRTNVEALIERETRPVVLPKVRRTQKNLLALGHKIAREAELTDEEYRDFAEIVTGKRSMGQMTKEERNEFVSALEESYGAPKELLPEDYDMPINVAGRGTSMRKVYGEAVKTTDALEAKRKIPSIVKIGFGKITKPLQATKAWLFGVSNTPPYHLARRLDSGKDGIFSLVLDKGIQQGSKTKKSHKRAVMTALQSELQERGVTADDLAKMGRSVNPRLQTYQMIKKGAAPEVFIETINNQGYEMTWANLMHIYLYINQEDGMRHTKDGGLVIHGIEAGPLSDERINDIQRKVEENPKAKAIVDTILKIGEQIWMPSINQVSKRTEGKDIATIPNWFGLRIWKPRKMVGKVRPGKRGPREINLTEDRSIFKDRTKSTLPLIVGDVFNEFTAFENAISEYVGMAEPYRTARTLLNDSDIVRMLDQKGYSPIYDRIRRIYKRASETSTSPGSVTAWFEKHLPALYRAVVHFNPRLIASQATSTWNYGAYVSEKYMPTAVKNGFSVKAIQRTMRLSDVAWDRFYMAHTSLEMGEAAHADAALRLWTGGKSADINKAGYAAKAADATALTGGMETAWLEYEDARNGTIDGLSAEWWIDKENLPEMNINAWEKIQEQGEDAIPEERQTAEQWKRLVTERAEWLWQRSQPSWDKENRSDLTSQRGFAKMLYMFRSFHEKSLTIFNECALDYHYSNKTIDDKMKFARRTGPVITGYVLNAAMRAAIMIAITRKAKEPIKYFEEFFTSWMSMFPIFGRVLRQVVTRFIDTLADAKPSYTGEPLDPYFLQVANMALKSPTDMSEAMAHFIMGDIDEAEDALTRGVNKLVEGVGTLEGVPVTEVKRVLPKGEEEPGVSGRRGPAVRKPAVRRPARR